MPRELNIGDRVIFYVPEGADGPWDGPRTRIPRKGSITDRRGFHDSYWRYFSISENNGQEHKCVEEREVGVKIESNLRLVK